jgi:hypothetical protein
MERLGRLAREAVGVSGFYGSGSNQSLTSGDAGASEIAKDFLMGVHGMKER